VSERDETVLLSLPDRHRSDDPAELESPVADERHIVVEPAADSVRRALAAIVAAAIVRSGSSRKRSTVATA
jgi:hypothetical protein